MIWKIGFIVASVIFFYTLLFIILGCFSMNAVLSKAKESEKNNINVSKGTRRLFWLCSLCFGYMMFFIFVL